MNLEEEFKLYFKSYSPENINRCPYRVCPIGAHVDHQRGNISGFALEFGIKLIYKSLIKESIELYSLNFDGVFYYSNDNLMHTYSGWRKYIYAAIKSFFAHGYKIEHGFVGVLDGQFSVGGLASSASLILIFLDTLFKVNSINITKNELIMIAFEAERKYLNLKIGLLDQLCETYCKKNSLLYVDISNNIIKNLPLNHEMPVFKIGIIYIGVPRNLLYSNYNSRVIDCRYAARLLKKYGDIPYDDSKIDYLRDVPQVVFNMYKNKLPNKLKKRAEHYYSEISRLKKGVRAWKLGDIETFGRLITESGDSSIKNYENCSEEYCVLHDIATRTEGIWGGRVSGAGFSGCYMFIIDIKYLEKAKEHIIFQFLKRYPKLKNQLVMYFSDTADGMDI